MLTRKCSCNLCTRRIAIEALVADIDPKHHDFIRAMVDALEEAEFNVDYYEAIFDGSWPAAEEILTRHLDRVKCSNQSQKSDSTSPP